MLRSRGNCKVWIAGIVLFTITVVLTGWSGDRLDFVNDIASLFQVKSKVIDSGGGKAYSSNITVMAAIGQPAVGHGSSQSYQYDAGFLAAAEPVIYMTLGDVNDDGICNSTDALVILTYDVGMSLPAEYLELIGQSVGDLNSDDLTNSTDALIELSYDVGIEVPFPVCEVVALSRHEGSVAADGTKDVGGHSRLALAEGSETRTTATSFKGTFVSGERVVIPVNIELGDASVRVGSFTAGLSWDPEVLGFVSFSGGTASGFSGPLVNVEEVSIGHLTFANAHAEGADGLVNILNVEFEVIGPEGSFSSLDLQFSAFAAAHTFSDLLGGLKVEGGKVAVRGLPTSYILEQNYPNPFNPETVIGYQLPEAGYVTLSIYNVLGQKVKTLVDGQCYAGRYTVVWDGKDESGREVTSGVYLYTLAFNDRSHTRKMLVMK